MTTTEAKSTEVARECLTVGQSNEDVPVATTKRSANPLTGYSHQELRLKGRKWALQHGLDDPVDVNAFELGAVLAQAPEKFDECEGLTAVDAEFLRREYTSRWAQPWRLYMAIVLCSICAVVQGMGESGTSPPSLRNFTAELTSIPSQTRL